MYINKPPQMIGFKVILYHIMQVRMSTTVYRNSSSQARTHTVNNFIKNIISQCCLINWTVNKSKRELLCTGIRICPIMHGLIVG